MVFTKDAQLPCIDIGEHWDERVLAFETIAHLARIAEQAIENGISTIPPGDVVASVANANIHKRAVEIRRQISQYKEKNGEDSLLELPHSMLVASLYLGRSVLEGSQDEYLVSHTFPSREIHALGKIGTFTVIDDEQMELYRSAFNEINPLFDRVQGPRQLLLKVRRKVLDGVSGDEWAIVVVKQTISKLLNPYLGVETSLTSRISCAVNLNNPHLTPQEVDSLSTLSRFRDERGDLLGEEAELHRGELRALVADNDTNARCDEPIVMPILQTVYQLRKDI